MKEVESDANVRMSYFQIHHLKQSAREQLMTEWHTISMAYIQICHLRVTCKAMVNDRMAHQMNSWFSDPSLKPICVGRIIDRIT
jgi:hypothetical protein